MKELRFDLDALNSLTIDNKKSVIAPKELKFDLDALNTLTLEQIKTTDKIEQPETTVPPKEKEELPVWQKIGSSLLSGFAGMSAGIGALPKVAYDVFASPVRGFGEVLDRLVS